MDGGASQVQNEIFVTGIGRVQVTKAIKPYARVAMAADRYNLFAYWNSRTSLEPQFSLQSGLPIEERSDIFHVEGQTNCNFQEERGRVVVGGSVRNTQVNTSGTLMNLVNDDRSDDLYSVYGQVEYKLIPQVRVVGALRWDDGDLFERQFSPKGALVFSPDENNSFRFSVNQAFQTPNYSEFFLQVPVAAPTTGPGTLQATIQGYYQQIAASPLAPDTDRPDSRPCRGTSWARRASFLLRRSRSATRTSRSRRSPGGSSGTRAVSPRTRTSRSMATSTSSKTSSRTFCRASTRRSTRRYALDSEVDLPAELATLDGRLAGAGLPANHPLRAAIPQLLAGYGALQAGTRIGGANALATLPGGSRAIVLSYTNAGKVTERGVEVGVGYQLTPEFRGDVTFTGFDFTVKSQAVGDQLVPNTPSKKASAVAELCGAAGRRRQRHRPPGGRLSVGGRRVPGLRAVERVRERERGVPGQQLLPHSRDGYEPVRSEAVPALRRKRDRAAGAGGNHGGVLGPRRSALREAQGASATGAQRALRVRSCVSRAREGRVGSTEPLQPLRPQVRRPRQQLVLCHAWPGVRILVPDPVQRLRAPSSGTRSSSAPPCRGFSGPDTSSRPRSLRPSRYARCASRHGEHLLDRPAVAQQSDGVHRPS